MSVGRCGLSVARFTLAAWIGAAALFVVTGVREVTTTDPILANSPVRDALVAVRFPAYYLFGFALVGLALLGLLAAYRLMEGSRTRYFICLALVAAGYALMFVDYFTIYVPLLEMVTPAGKAKSSEFTALHEASKRINILDLSLLLIAGMWLSWPPARHPPEPAPSADTH